MKSDQQYAYIETFGCQMNERDSEIMAQLLADRYCFTSVMDHADLVVINTCSIRDKAEQKAFSLLGRLRKLKKDKPHLLIAVAGCVAQVQGSEIRQRMPHVDVVIGPQHIYELPEMLDAVRAKKRPQRIATMLADSFEIPSFLPDLRAGHPHKRFVTIMQGCNNFCTYCVVPYTRGREISRSMDDILAEIRHLADNGIKEVTLLGQNVNSYGLDKKDDAGRTFPALLRQVADIDGIQRIRFTTSHPKDLSEELMRCFAEVEKLCPHFHLPVQSGSDRILKRMNRHYTVAEYLKKIEMLHLIRADIAFSTDLIVGFPGETEEDFRQTMDLLEIVRYHGAFSFKYSDRAQAKASAFPDKVDEPVKVERLAILQARQEEITLARLGEFVGSTTEVMLEGESRTGSGQWSGRTVTNHIVNFDGIDGLAGGQFADVRIDEACLHSLKGSLCSVKTNPK